MKIAIITENFPPCAGGGIAEWAMGIADGIGQAGHEVTVLTRWRSDVPTSIHDERPFGVRVMHGRDWRKTRSWNSAWAIMGYLIRHPESILVATTWELGVGFQFLKPLFPKAGLVLIAHGKEVTQLKHVHDIRRFRKTLDVSAGIIAVSRFTQAAIREAHPNYPADAVHFVPNGVDAERFQRVDPTSLRERLGIASDDRIILTLARVIARKGHDTVIQCLPAMIEKYPNTRYVIAGPWKEHFYLMLQSMIRELCLEDHVIFTGFVDDADLNAFYSMSDVYVMVSRETGGDSEGFGITFLEAGACECPVIGSRSGGIEDAVEDGVNGYLVDPDDSAALAEKVLGLFNDPILAKQIGEAGRKRALAGFTWAGISERVLEVIKGSLESRVLSP